MTIFSNYNYNCRFAILKEPKLTDCKNSDIRTRMRFGFGRSRRRLVILEICVVDILDLEPRDSVVFNAQVVVEAGTVGVGQNAQRFAVLAELVVNDA